MKIRSMKKVIKKPIRKPITPENVVIIVTTYQSDDILQIINKLQNYGHKVNLVYTDKFKKNDIEYTQKEIEDELARLFNGDKLEPQMIITDHEILNEKLLNFEESYSIYSLTKAISATRQQRYELLRQVKSETTLTKIKVNYNDYPRTKENVYELMITLPRFCVFFSAFGYYRKQYNFKVIVKSFFKFLERQDKIFGNSVMLALGGNFNRIFDDLYYKNLDERIRGKFASNIVLLKDISTEEKKAFLRLSFAMMYFNESGDPNPDVKLAMSVGTPLIGPDDGYIRNVIKKEPLSGYLVPLHLNTIVNCMYSLTQPTTYQRASNHSRLNYLKNYTKFGQELAAIKAQGRKKKHGRFK